MAVDKKELRKEKVKESIKEAALNIAEKEGWNKVTIRKIADEVLYTPPIVYEYFKNKEDLYKHLVMDGFEKLHSTTLASLNDSQTAEEKLTSIAEIRFDFVTQNQTLHHMMFDAENPEWQSMALGKSIRVIKDLVENLLEEISGEKEQVHEYFFNMVCLIKGYSSFQKHMQDMPNPMKKAILREIKDFKPMFLRSFQRFINSIKKEA